MFIRETNIAAILYILYYKLKVVILQIESSDIFLSSTLETTVVVMFRSGNWFLGLVAVLLGAPQQACSFAPSLAVVPALGRPSAATTTTATMLPYFPLRVASPRLGSSVVRSQSLSEGGEEEKKSLWHKLKDGAKMDKKKLGSLGLYALLSYGFVSNASYAVGIGAAWLVVVSNVIITTLDLF
jgi:hypothetical protein